MTSAFRRELSEAVVIVAGATGVLGSHIVRRLDERGARLVLLGRERERLPAVRDGAVVLGDLRDAELGGRAVELATSRFGRLDGVVNAAGVVAFGPLEGLRDDVLAEMFEVNVFGPLRLLRAAIPHLEGGFIVNLSAVVAELPTANMLAYSASKAALTAASAALRLELRRRKITVVDVRPPHTDTGLATRPIAGRAPRLPEGLPPDFVADRVVTAIERGEREVPSTAFRTARGPEVQRRAS
jgi:NAD(P)-dependent dehydrogenase (short-subunit alcohol dehydrogenase family)